MKFIFSIIINTYNRAHTIERTLSSLQNLRHERYEVIVVNGPSTDGTEEILEKYKDMIRIGNCAEANLSKSRNVGLQMARGDIVCYIDDDAVPESNWLNQLEIGYSDDSVAAVGGYIRDHTGYTYQSRALLCDRFGVGSDYQTLEEAQDAINVNNELYYSLTGTNCSFRKSALINIGGFDEEFAYFLDETDVVIRLVDSGYRVVYVPSAEIHHKYAESHLRGANKVPKSIYLPARSKAYFCVRHASKIHYIDGVFKHLEAYRKQLRLDYDWYLHNQIIDESHHKRLHDEIDLGVHDGIKDAFSFPNGRLMTSDVGLSEGKLRLVKNVLSSNNRLKICFLSQDYPPKEVGGIGVWTHELATALAAKGHEVTVVTKGHNHNTVDFEDGVWVHRVVPVWHPNRNEPELPDVAQVIKDYAYTVYDEVMRINVIRGLDIVSSPIWDLEGIACVANGKIPTVVSLHSTFKLVLPTKPEWTTNKEYFDGHIAKMIKGEEWVLKKASHILANSHAIVNDIESSYHLSIDRHKLSIVPHGIESVDQTLFIKEKKDTINLLFVGRFENRKGIDLFLNIIPKLFEENSNLDIDLVGNNDVVVGNNLTLKDMFLNKYKSAGWINKVRFHGVVDSAKLNQHYRNCDIFIAPSRYESFGLIFIEAMRWAKPCIGINVGGVGEVIQNNVSGILINSPDEDELFNATKKLIENKPLRESIGLNALNRFKAKFTTGAMANGCLEAYLNALEK